MNLEIIEEPKNQDSRLLVLKGRLNAVSAPELKVAIKSAFDQHVHFIILDLAEVSFLDSSGLSALVSGLKQAKEVGGRFCLVRVAEQAMSVLKLTKLDGIFEIFATSEEALGK